MRIKKNRIQAIVALVVLLYTVTCIPVQAMSDRYGDTIDEALVTAYGNEENGDNGSDNSSDVNRTRKNAITKRYNEWKDVSTPTSMYSVEPSLSVPYNTGTLNEGTLNKALETLLYIRFLAGLETPITMDPEWNASAQAGALVNAVNGQLSHKPSKPKDMDEALYQKGYSATSTGNIAWGYRTLSESLWGYMDDGDPGNIDRLGHRRWLINPAMTTVGFGMVDNGNYSVSKVFDDETNTIWYDDTDYDYITWPSEGAFPSHAFGTNHPWSISLNEKRYNNKEINDVEVMMTNLDTGNVETFKWNDDRMKPNAYFNVETNGYGIPYCIIFRPDSGTNDQDGHYRIDISGVKDLDGREVAISYQVEFFNSETWNVTSSIEGSNVIYARALKEAGLFQGTDKGFELERAPTRIEGLVMFLRLLGVEDEALRTNLESAPFKDIPVWGRAYVNYAYSQGLIKGISANQFGSMQPMRAKDYQTLILRAFGYEEGEDFTWETSLQDALSEGFMTPNMYDWLEQHSFMRSDLVAASYYAYERQ